MKKLYFLDEEEKNRILNIHESATKRQYLNEQTSPFGAIPNNPLGFNTQSGAGKKDGLTREKNWETLYACVHNQGKKPTKLSDGSTCYIINGITYYNNGRKKLANGQMANYDCNTEFKTNTSTDDKAKKLQQYKQQIVAKTTENTKAIQKLLGLPETGVMDSGLLQKINEKLNGKPQDTPKSEVTTPPAAAGATTPTTGTPAGGIAQAQQQVGMNSDQLNDAIKQLQANANRPR
jgi:hypothetical protein